MLSSDCIALQVIQTDLEHAITGSATLVSLLKFELELSPRMYTIIGLRLHVYNTCTACVVLQGAQTSLWRQSWALKSLLPLHKL